MSPRRRFQFLEGKRPEREDEGRASGEKARFSTLGKPAQAPREAEAAGTTTACASCGTILADANADCPACSGSSSWQQQSPRVSRFQTLGGNGPIGLGREVASRTPESEVAGTVPAWRGEAMPEDVAAEVRAKLGPPRPWQQPGQSGQQREEGVLEWADRQLERNSVVKWMVYLAGAFYARRLVNNLIGLAVAVFAAVFFLLYRACN